MGRCIVKWVDRSAAGRITHRQSRDPIAPYFFEVVTQETLQKAYDAIRQKYALKPLATGQRKLYSGTIDNDTYFQVSETGEGVEAIKLVSSGKCNGDEIAPKIKELAEHISLPTRSLESFLSDRKD